MPAFYDIVRWVIEGTIIYVTGTLTFDLVHFSLHRLGRSRFRILRRIGQFHDVHHRWLNTSLKYNDRWARKNLLMHRIPEYLNQITVTFAFAFIFDLGPVLVVAAFHTITLLAVLRVNGRDSNHAEYTQLPNPGSNPFVGSVYHAYHHAFPDQYMGSFVRMFDWIAGTATQIRGRRFVVTGASGAFGSGIVKLLKKEGAHVRTLKFGKDYTYTNYEKVLPTLAWGEVLVLAHGAKKDKAMQANCVSFVKLIELFKMVAKRGLAPLEVWAVGSEIEMHPAWGSKDLAIYLRSKRAFARYAWEYYRDETLHYRHIVPSAFSSPMGPGLISGLTAARIAMFFIKRGFRYVPVSYTGFAALNYFKFLLLRGRKARLLPMRRNLRRAA
jgi:hypothetical protein